MSRIAHAPRHSALRLGALAAAAVVAAGCSEITEAVSGQVGDVEGSYVLTHHNGNPVPATIGEDSEYRETLVSGTLDVDVLIDTTFVLTVVETDTNRRTGESHTGTSSFRGPLTLTGNTARLTVTWEDGEAEDQPWTLTGDVRDGVLHVDFGGESNIDVASFRKR